VRFPLLKSIAAGLVLAIAGSALAQEAAEGRWALAPYACDGEAFTRPETPLIVTARSVHWFDANCSILSNYKVNQTLYLEGRCLIEGRTATIPIMLEPRSDRMKWDRLRVGWNREPIQEMQRCR